VQKVIEVVDTKIFEQKLQMAETILPFVLSLLTTQKAVSRFLEKTPLTIANMVRDERLKEGIHYIKEGKKTVFIAEAIVQYKIKFLTLKLQPSTKPINSIYNLLVILFAVIVLMMIGTVK